MTKLIPGLQSNKRRKILALIALATLVIASIFYTIFKLNSRIDTQREQQAAAERIEVQVSQLRAPASDGFTAYLNASDIRATTFFNDSRYLATSGGLLLLDESGRIKHRYTTLDGLTDNDLTAL